MFIMITIHIRVCKYKISWLADNHLNWKKNMDKMIRKLHGACYGIKFMFHTGNTETLETICFVYFYCVMKCTLIMWSFSTYSKKTFTLQ